jgi:hypothetical protein
MLVLLLLALAAGGRWHRELYGLFCGACLAATGGEGWAGELHELGTSGTPGCRLAWRLNSDPEVRRRAALALGHCAGARALNELVEMEGVDTPAERALLDLFEFYCGDPCGDPVLPPPDAEVEVDDPGPPPQTLRAPGNHTTKTSLVYVVGAYRAEIGVGWTRAFSAWGGPKTGGGHKCGPWRRSGLVRFTVTRDDGPRGTKVLLDRQVDRFSGEVRPAHPS